MKTMRIVILTALMFVLMACSSKSILEQSEITVKSNSRASIVAKSGADRYHWREISGIKVKIVDPYSQRLEFVAPDVSKKEMLVFELEAHFGEVTRTAEVMVIVLPLEEGYDNTSTDDSNTTSSGYDNGSTRSDDNNATTDEDDNTTGDDTPLLRTLTLTIPKTTLNKDTNTTIELTATYDDNTTKDVTNQAEWIIDHPKAVTIKSYTLIAKKDTNLTIQAKVGSTLSNKVNLSIYWEVNGHRLPPEPDPKVNNATLLGIDSNNNGVRDDVERWIYETYKEYVPCHQELDWNNTAVIDGKTIPSAVQVCEDHPVPYHPVVREAVMEIARQAQIIIQKPENAGETVKGFTAAFMCASALDNFDDKNGRKIRNKNLSGSDFDKIQFNTVQRARAYAKYNFYLGGGVYELPTDAYILKNWCSPKIREMIKDLK